MFLTFLDKLGGFFDRRFIIAFWMPVFVFVCLVGGTWIVLRGVTPTFKWWDTSSVTETTMLLGIALFGITLLAFLLQSFSTPLVRLYAGYWPVPWFQKWGEAKQNDKREKLGDNITELYYDYSQCKIRKVPQATRLGNVLTAAYDYSQDMYGANATIWWSRLSPLLPEAFRAQADNALTPLFALLNLCTLLVAAAICGSLLVALLNQRWWLLVLYLLGGGALARLCYYAAVSQAIAYGEQVRVAFDLYRDELIKKMRIPLPKSPWQEKELWKVLSLWTFNYVKPWQSLTTEPPPAQILFYDKEPSVPQHDETIISIGGTPLLKMTHKQADDVPGVPPTQGSVESQTKPAAKASADEAAKVDGHDAEPVACDLSLAAGKTEVTATGLGHRMQSWVYGRWMGWLILLLLFAIGGAEYWWMSRGTLTTVVRITRDVPPFTVLTRADVGEMQTRTPTTGALKSVQEAAGRISLEMLSNGTILTAQMLSASPVVGTSNLEGRQVFSVSAADLPHLSAGEEVILLGLKADTKQGVEETTTISSDAVSLGLQGDHLLLALRDDEVKRAATYLIKQRRLIVLRKLQLPTQASTYPPA